MPPLIDLPPDVRGCIVEPIVQDVRLASRSWSSYNLSRESALDLIPLEETTCSY